MENLVIQKKKKEEWYNYEGFAAQIITTRTQNSTDVAQTNGITFDSIFSNVVAGEIHLNSTLLSKNLLIIILELFN